MARWEYKLKLRLRSLFGKGRVERELSDEVRFHLEKQIEENKARGMSAVEARHAAMREFGGVEGIKEECRDARGVLTLEALGQDIGYGLRQLRRNPGFTAIATLTLALGLAANTAIFSVVEGVLLQPLAYPNPGQLVAVQLLVPKLKHQFPMVPLNPSAYLAWSQEAKSLDGISLIEEGVTLNLTGAGEPALLNADAVTANLFEVLGVRPEMGRNFLPEANQAGHNHEVILRHGLWQSRFHGDPSILGRSIALNGSPYTVVGILPPSFQFPHGNQLYALGGSVPPPDLFVPAVFEKWELAVDAGFGYDAIARLKPGVSQAQATAEMNVILSQRFAGQTFMPNPSTLMLPLRDMIVRASKPGLWMLLAAVLAVLLIICVNLANLVLTRATAREHEAAIHSALGASRGRRLRQTLGETLILGLLGGALGLALAHWALSALLALAPVDLPRVQNVRLDDGVLGFALAISILTGVLAGLLPAWRMAQANPQDALRSGSARGAESRTRLGARKLLVGLETALGAMLLIAAGLLLGSFAKLQSAPKGFAVDQILTANLQLPSAQYTQKQQRREFWRRMLGAAAELPGVESAAVADMLPLAGEWNDDPVNLPGDTRPVAERPFASYRRVSPAYFQALGIPLLRGRELTWPDADTDAVVISEAAAKSIWPGADPIGRRFNADPASGFAGSQVVGIVGDSRSVSLDKEPAPMVYELYGGGLAGSVILRTRLRGTAVAAELRRGIGKIDPGVAIANLRSMGQIVSTSLAPQRFETLLTSLFAAAALLLASLGIYGVVSYSVVRRTHEIGIRMALGAQKADVLRGAVAQGMMPALWGLGVGIIGALGLTRLLASLLYGVKPTDPLTFGIVALVLTGVALLACYIPARRAMRVDPIRALRHG